MGTPDKTYYIPWMQATYVLAVNKKALEHLPQGADVNALTYQQLEDWGANMQKATGKRLLGFPAGPNGLLHRFFQGYLYPVLHRLGRRGRLQVARGGDDVARVQGDVAVREPAVDQLRVHAGAAPV